MRHIVGNGRGHRARLEVGQPWLELSLVWLTPTVCGESRFFSVAECRSLECGRMPILWVRQNAGGLSAAECRSFEAAYELRVMEAEMARPNRKHAPSAPCPLPSEPMQWEKKQRDRMRSVKQWVSWVPFSETGSDTCDSSRIRPDVGLVRARRPGS